MSAITWDEAQSTLDGLKDTEYLIGFTSEGVPVTFDLDSERPHAHIMASSGAGATSLLKLFARQMDARSNIEKVHIIGPHRIPSNDFHLGFGKVENSRGSEETTPRVVADEWKLMIERFKEVFDAMMILRRRVLLIDRVDTLAHRTRPDVALTMFEQLAEIMALGRAAGFHVIASSYGGADRLGAEFLGNFGTQIVSRVTARRWAQLNTPDPMPEEIKTGQRGMFAVVRESGTIVTRAVYSD